MSDWTQIHPKLRLYDVLDTPGGVTVDQALSRAKTGVENHRGRAMGALKDALRRLEQLRRAADPGSYDEIYERAAFVLDIASLYAPALCRAANSLCDLAHRMNAAGRWDWPSVEVHVSSMHALFDVKDDTAPSVQAVLNGLSAVVARFPETSAPPPA